MPEHRIAKRAGSALATFGSTGQTVGIVADTSDGGVSTRNASPVGIKFCSDGSTIQALLDGVWGTKVLVDATATSMFTIATPLNAMVGGTVFFLAEFSDGTDFQVWSGQVGYAGYNKAATTAGNIAPTAPTGNPSTGSGTDAKSVSSGTLTLAWTIVAGTNILTVKLAASGSLTETTIRVTYFVVPIRGAVTAV